MATPKTASIVLTIPCLPDLDLSANRRRSRHYMEQARDTATERGTAGVILEAAKRGWQAGPPARSLASWFDGFDAPIALHWTLYWPKGTRARDADGCADMLKPWQDAMKDLGWIKGDSLRYIKRVSYEGEASSPKGPSMMLTIQAAEGADES